MFGHDKQKFRKFSTYRESKPPGHFFKQPGGKINHSNSAIYPIYRLAVPTGLACPGWQVRIMLTSMLLAMLLRTSAGILIL